MPGNYVMTNASSAMLKLVDMGSELPQAMAPNAITGEAARQYAARQIAVESKRLWHEAQMAGLDDIAQLMEEAFYRAYQQAGGPRAMRAV
jgi:hypothetical protein